MDWNAIGAIATAIGAIATAVGVLLIAWQLLEVQHATHAQAFFAATVRLQDEKLRSDRAMVFGLREKPVKAWSSDERAAAERVCHNYDVIGIMAKHGMLPTIMIIDSWGNSLRETWPILRPLVDDYRMNRHAPEFWDDFEWLATKAQKLHERRLRKTGGAAPAAPQG